MQICEESDGIHFCRFMESQRPALSSVRFADQKFQASAGIRMEFETDADSVELEFHLSEGSSREWYYFDAAMDGKPCLHQGSESLHEKPETTLVLRTDRKMHRFCVSFPNLACAVLKSAALDGGKILRPVKRPGRMLCFGDSITQGYDARHPSLDYAERIADAFNLELVNQAVGGDCFNPELLKNCGNPAPDCIIAAYGTNDWECSTGEELVNNSRLFFRELAGLFPRIPIFVVLPIWRIDCEKTSQAGSFHDLEKLIRRSCPETPCFHFTGGVDSVPHRKELFSPDGLHPNDSGSRCLADSLFQAMNPVLSGIKKNMKGSDLGR